MVAGRRRVAAVGRHVGVSPAWMGGHGTEPYEQNTQQSPGFGRRSSPQPMQSKKNWQASVGMVSAFAVPQFGRVIVDSKITGVASRIHEPKDRQNRTDR